MQIRFQSNLFSYISRVCLNLLPLLPSLLTQAFPFFLSFLLVLSCTSKLLDIMSSWCPPISSRTLLTALPHLVLARPFGTFSRAALVAMAGNLFFGMLLTLYCRFNFLTPLFVLSRFPALFLVGTVLLVSSYLVSTCFRRRLASASCWKS